MTTIAWRITRRGTQLAHAVPCGIGGWTIIGTRLQSRIFYRPDRIGD
ncbi:MAG: hypothetical protein RLZZ127_1994 [Planctomycetota bacterium]